MLGREEGIVVAAQTRSLAEAREALERLDEPIDIALVDLDLPDGSGVEVIHEIRRHNPAAQVIVWTGSVTPKDRAYAVEAGAAGVLHKSIDISEVAKAIRQLSVGESLISPRETIDLLRLAGRLRADEQLAQGALNRLTEREREVLSALADGLSDKDIAERLGVSPKTARGHVVNVLGKLGVDSRLQAVVLAVRLGAIDLS
jgi:DNA-binding NarL/FixJ family response regulator